MVKILEFTPDSVGERREPGRSVDDPFFTSRVYDTREDFILGLIGLARQRNNMQLRSEIREIYTEKGWELPRVKN
ncbi:MAG: hypothetical protein UU81_C0044G0006 [Microgenomates group bacterium GW2011_GWC1_41_8]|uniref:Uncharacterized protein n=3 Tax=Candidatus Roizmaniibacteriota TaxID=1752723 RepID=A0A0G0XCJ8_9BACT|nr:MAG: hypothetical protein UU14_C0008G0028 [Candidatus Roizmanbacteria bacterium GW2011_GWB1_40_7]KKR94284.1 MAG: hypothetical protein UU41_C0009G0030 [Candidatus Roizmanbacteria bacterium GW2011_GWA1_41_13]KKS22102.1 MAG: hypothetical protein UU78_C0023G0028 [Candidatus Roizmanbacteria bacterium GW2011_GWC2_41_7]KKS22970.1 MAG: hypothetical protein UU81_C0044G0006 [Microgenomates group bacterium GW2011_GWC1_41_8]